MATTTRRRRWIPPEDLRQLDASYVRCRTLGHAWDDFIPMRKPAKFGDRLSLRCLRCETERHDIVSWIDGSLLQREYVHPEGYAMAEKHTRSEFRATLLAIRRDEVRAAERAATGTTGTNGSGSEVDVTDAAMATIGRARAPRMSRAGRGSGRQPVGAGAR